MSKTKIDLNDLDKYFKKSELIPAIAFDADTKTVLMLAYMNKESLRKTLGPKNPWFYSPNVSLRYNLSEEPFFKPLQKVVSIYSDCDDDTLLINVKQTGAACHTGSYSCFFNEMYNDEEEN